MGGRISVSDTMVAILSTLIIIVALHTIWMAGQTVMQVTKGYYILDSDAPQGLRLRKWFLIIVTPTITLRVIVTIMEVLFRFFTNQNNLVLIAWSIRTLPSFLFLLALSFLGDYLWQIVEMLTQSNSYLLIARYSSLLAMIFLFTLEIFYWTKVVISKQEEWYHAQQTCAILSIGGFCISLSLIFGIVSVAQSLQKSHVANASKILARFLLLYGCITVTSIVIGFFRGYQAFISHDDFRKTQESSTIELALILITECIGSWILILTLTNRTIFVEDWFKKTILKTRRVGFANISGSNSVQVGISPLPTYSQLQQQPFLEMSSINYTYVDPISQMPNDGSRIGHAEIPTYPSYGAIS